MRPRHERHDIDVRAGEMKITPDSIESKLTGSPPARRRAHNDADETSIGTETRDELIDTRRRRVRGPS